MPTQAEDDLLHMNTLKGGGSGKRKARKSRPRRRLWDWRAIVTRAFVVGAGGAILFHVLTWSIRPLCQAWLVSQDIPALERRHDEARAKRTELEWDIRYASSEKGSKNMARTYGYVEEGEVPLVLPERDELTREFEKPAPRKLTLWDKFMFMMCRVCKAGPEVVDPSEAEAAS